MSEHTPSTSAYSDAELEHFKAEDFAAGKAVVILMLGIFSTGVFIYTVVAFWVMKFSGAPL
jgi:hypothetical protein